MTLNDFNNFFDLQYNTINSFKGAPINVAEKSLFCTKAYHQIVRENAIALDSDEKRRTELSAIFVNGSVSYDVDLNTTLGSLKINSTSKLFALPEGVWYIGHERLHDDNGSVKVIPMRVDDYNEVIENPFKKPNSKKAWRLSVGSNTSDPEYIVEIITTLTPTKYTFRYLKEPEPIIISDLTPFGLDLNGQTDPNLPKIHDGWHHAIVDRAVTLATQAYKNNELQSQLIVKRDN